MILVFYHQSLFSGVQNVVYFEGCYLQYRNVSKSIVARHLHKMNHFFLNFQADLLTLFYMWFPCCTCLKGMINRTYSVVTKESFLIRHQSKPKKTNSNHRDKLQKRLLIVEKKPGCSGSRNMTCDEEQLELVCKLFVDNVSELGSVMASADQWYPRLRVAYWQCCVYCLWIK